MAQPDWAKGVDELVWGNGGGIEGDPAIAATMKAFEEWSGIDVKIVPIPDVATASAWGRTLALGETTYDVLDVIPGVGNPEWPRNGWIVPLDDVVPDSLRADWLPAAVAAATYEDQLYWIPHYGQMLMLGYRTDLLEEAGISGPPTTWEELIDVAEALTLDSDGDGTPERYGFAFPTVGNFGLWTFKSFLKGAGGHMWNEDGSPAFLGEEGLKALEFVDRLSESSLIPSGVSDYTAGDAGEIWKGGEVAMALMSTGGVIDAALQSEPYGQYLGLAPVPTIKPPEEMANPCIYNTSYNAVMVNGNSRHLEAAKQLALFFGTAASSLNEGAVEGNIPVVRSVYDDPRIVNGFNFSEPILEAFSRACTDIHPGYAAYLTPITKAISNVILDIEEPEEALRTLEKELQDLGII
ncbi:MAG TPA: extracellular solute-binding protein [Trueperaceae bacterium]